MTTLVNISTNTSITSGKQMLLFLWCSVLLTSCGIYSFKDYSIPSEVKTVRINYIGNKARYINPQLSPQLTDRLRQKINNQTRLTQTQNEDAHYDISGYVQDYNLSTGAVSGQQASLNQLTVGIHLIFKNRLDDKKSFETDVSRSFPFDAKLQLAAAEAQLSEEIIRNMSDEIFNRIFSNW
jgi:Lipopolysaccharide-assembly